ncbi:MAG TPA: hypothetical protein VGO81_20145 [Solirubrobacteraceae bacterium]|jgi:hypothetical protein|nr:hypothetical protein [Solirubrobacteraceae bacterium]
MRREWPRDVKLTTAACAAAVASALYLSVTPVYRESSGGHASHGASLFADGQLVQAIAALVAPLVLCAAPLLFPERRRRPALRVAASVATAFVIVAGFTVGLFFVPSAVLLVLAARSAGARLPGSGEPARRRVVRTRRG